MSEASSRQVLEGVRVIELVADKGQLCGRLLADLGADVVKVEAPDGGRARRQPPYGPAADGLDASLSFAWYNANKRSVVLDLARPDGLDRLRGLAADADVLVDDLPPGALARLGLDPDELCAANPRLVYCSITGFGLDGPYAGYLAPDPVVFAMSGLMHIAGEPGLPPLRWPYEQGYQLASITAGFGVVAALRARLHTGAGQRVEVSAQETLAGIQHVVANYSANSQILARTGTRSPVGGLAAPQGAYRCRDGYVYLSIIWPAHWKALVEWMGSPEALTDPIFETRQVRCDNREFIDVFVEEFLAQRTKQELFVEGQRHRTFIAPINTPAEFTEDTQIAEREFFVPVEHPELGRLPMPGMPYQLDRTPLRYRRPAPRLGEHTTEVLGGGRAAASPGADPPRPLARPLDGIRIIDFTHAIAGPTLTRVLAEFGAEVIKVESQRHSQRGRVKPEQREAYRQQAATFTDLNRNKLSLTLNMELDEARDVMRELVRHSDVVVNNFSPRVMRKWGLDHESLRAINPGIIAVDMPGYGLDGPHRDFIAGAVIVQGLSGAFHLWDYGTGGSPASPPSWYADYGTGVMAGVGIMSAIYHRDLTGSGQHVEQSQLEAIATLLAPAYLDYFVNDVDEGPLGVHSAEHAPYGPYPCRGDDRWCFIAVETDEQWRQLVAAMDEPEWAQAPEFEHNAGRLEAGSRLVDQLAAWTRQQTPHQVMRRLQERGVPAGVVMTGEDLYHDPHLRARGFLCPVEHPAIGTVDYPGLVVRLSGTPGTVGAVPAAGQHNQYLLREVLRYDDEQIEKLIRAGALT